MTLKELREIISEAPAKDWFLTVEFDVTIPSESFSKKFVGIPSLFKFIRAQYLGWEGLELASNSKLATSKNLFMQAHSGIIQFVRQRNNEENINNLNSWSNNAVRQSINRLNNKSTLFYNSAKTKFLEVVKEYNLRVSNYTFEYITEQLQNHSFSNKEAFEGYVLGANFEGTSYNFGTRKGLEKSSISEIKRLYRTSSENIENDVTEVITALKDKYNIESTIVENLRESYEQNFEDLITAFNSDAENFEENSKKKISDLEKAYNELLKLKEPAKYWNDRAKQLKSEGRLATGVMLFTLLLIAGAIYFILWLTPEGMLKSFSESTSSAIKWSVAFVAFLSTCVFAVRVLNKIAFSSFHLARDAEEREQLCYVYLALINESTIDKEERLLILQSLFSRAETGLLKDDSGPTMPTGIVSKLFSGK